MGQFARFLTFLIAVCLTVAELNATPQFARQYRRDCSYCHLAPPILNRTGEDFLARGYRFDAPLEPVASHERTVPLAVWNSIDYEHRSNTNRAFPSRIELISAGPIGGSRAVYFAEWRLLSQQIASGNTLLNRSGRFEDLFVTAPLGPMPLSVTIGQFRSISQVDVSRRLSISEPQVFSASLPGRVATSPRVTGLRAFSPSGRQPGVRFGWQQPHEGGPAHGWQAVMTIPFPGEFTIPMTDAASFEVEGKPKGVVLESFWRARLNSLGGHAFIGSNRWIAQAVGVVDVSSRLVITAAGGVESVAGNSDGRYGIQGELFFNRVLSAAARIEDRTGAGRRSAGILTLNLHVPFGADWFRQALRLQVEQRIQARDHRTQISLSHIF